MSKRYFSIDLDLPPVSNDNDDGWPTIDEIRRAVEDLLSMGDLELEGRLATVLDLNDQPPNT